MIFKGLVKKQTGRGRKLGYPTANIEVPADAEEGVFVGYTRILSPFPSPPPQGEGKEKEFLPLEGGGEVGVKLPSIIFIGAPETFGETDKRLETYILDWEGDLYGRTIEVEIIKKLRENEKFESEAALTEQMKIDESKARRYFP